MKKDTKSFRTILAIVTGLVALLLVFVMTVYSAIPTASYAIATLLLVLLGILAFLNQRALREAARTRSVRYGANAALTLGLVVAIGAVLSYLNYNHFVRKDLTRNKEHSLSDQTLKILRELKQDVSLAVYVKTGDRDGIRTIIDNYRYQTKKLSLEWIDPDRDPVRTKAANVKKYGTIIVKSGKLESRVEDATEEKLTNGILKVLKDTPTTVCFLTGHGERDSMATSPDGYSRVVQELQSQNYESKPVSLQQDAKIPEVCSVLLVIGPEKSFFDKEVAAIGDWLDAGGRALFALDPNIKGNAPLSREMVDLLAKWWIDVPVDIVLDPASKVANLNATVPLVGIFSKESPITRDLSSNSAALFPLTSTVDFKPNVPNTITTFWLAKSTQYAFAKRDFQKEFATGRVAKDPNKDQQGPNIVMAAVNGSRPGVKKPDKGTRIVVLGTAQMGVNKWVNFGGNIDLFLNSVSWLAGDENLISIRPKDETKERAMLSDVELGFTKFLTMLLMPFGTVAFGVGVWFRRRKL